VGGAAAVATGCRQCHGSNIRVLKDGRLDPETWPNTGIGRINPDGSKGSCSACHTRHRFSKEQARRPDACGKCHLGPDHPQIEVYQESKHGVLYQAFRDKMIWTEANGSWGRLPGHRHLRLPYQRDSNQPDHDVGGHLLDPSPAIQRS
jgi:hypothetical protein